MEFLAKEDVVLMACLLKSTDMGLDAEDAVGDAKQLALSLSASPDPEYGRLLARGACILLSSNRLCPDDAIAEARKIMAIAGY